MRDFLKLEVWKRAHRLVLDIYAATASFPQAERYGLQSQTRRAAASIPANLAEGSGRRHRPDYARFIDIATASASELEYHLILAKDLGHLKPQTFTNLRRETRSVRAMLTKLSTQVSQAGSDG